MKFSPVALAAVMNIAVPLYAQAPGAHEVSASGGIASIGGDDAATVSSPWVGASYAIRAGRGYIKFDYEVLSPPFYERDGAVPLDWRGLAD